MFCPSHPEQRVGGNGKKHILHLPTPDQLKARGMANRRARLVINDYPGAGVEQRVA
ncbi:hypothetical protein [Cyanobium sp. Morenito 9A2]|uniref:hypothetical protein n=1 Tax=Cyanobium sp. Morenito 9A2 TaxID=2823718 RepID=UPI0020CD997F|nr:hypothetical protein [Cyanobium sp. Morenito 9A2]MCP9849580.1 hypothetical protein [Cyanobium sp. Morenito 9A2]